MSTPRKLSALPPPGSSPAERLRGILAELDEFALADLPALLGELARGRELVAARMLWAAVREGREQRDELLTAEKVAEWLHVSMGEVYRRAKGDLKPATVNLGPGTLRFSRQGVEKFIQAGTGV